jgi:hypothetical protein
MKRAFAGAAWAAAVGAGCGGTSFTLATEEGGHSTMEAGSVDAPSSRPDVASHPDGGRRLDAKAPTPDASHPHDVSLVDVVSTADVVVPPMDATGPMDSSHPMDAARDAVPDAIPNGCTAIADNGMVPDFMYVLPAPQGTASATCGTIDAPCTLVAALAKANVANGAMAGSTIYVGPGTYALGAPVAVPYGVTLVGGWSMFPGTNGHQYWAAGCPNVDAGGLIPVIQVSAAEAMTVGASVGSPVAGTVLRDLSIETIHTALPSESVYGIVAVGASGDKLTLSGVTISVPGRTAPIARRGATERQAQSARRADGVRSATWDSALERWAGPEPWGTTAPSERAVWPARATQSARK